ncbi:LysR family transcriptional regulator [Tomitella gaofuii]|uniref:LysR family transcriptional regulator n=1 Tax=Tomitella gaofuii TaxID=2760083 RepID=UPI0015FD9CBF|nr:LysR family transcriptional regulator [Tomitella gaofuii]
MDVRQLHTFTVVASEMNFTRAASELHTVQSAVSATIRSLEREVGTALFDRTLRQVRLTPAGDALLPEAQRVLDAVRGARDAVDATAGRVTGSVTLGYMTSVTLVDIPALLQEFSRSHDQVAVRLKAAEHGTAGLIDMLRSAQLDLALVVHVDDTPGVEMIPVSSSPMRLIVPSGHPLAGVGPVAGLDALSGERFIDFPDGFGPRRLTDAAFRAAGADRRVAFETMDIAAAGDLVAHGLGVAFLPEFIVGRLANTQVVPLMHELGEMVVSVATLRRRPLSTAVRALRSLILETRGDGAARAGRPVR